MRRCLQVFAPNLSERVPNSGKPAISNDLSAELGEKLLSVDSPTVSNAIERFGVRPRRYASPPFGTRRK